MPDVMCSYYHDKLTTISNLFGVGEIELGEGTLRVREKVYPIVEDVIILLPESRYTAYVQKILRRQTARQENSEEFSSEIQYSFGEEWKTYGNVLEEHRHEFEKYFDLIDLEKLHQWRVCDLGCGSGRWSHFLQPLCRELILVDFSDAIFVARKNLAASTNSLFFMGDLAALPFRDNFADLLVCLGVLHHLPVPCLNVARRLVRSAPESLVYLYYRFDNRPSFFRILFRLADRMRTILSKAHHPFQRKFITLLGTYLLYLPLISLGRLLRPLGLGQHVPLYPYYHDKSIARIKQDVYDRFFTTIEQRVTRAEIAQLQDTFSEVILSEGLPYWHFLCKR